MAPDSAIRPVDTKVKGGKPRTLKKTPLNHVKLREVLEKWVMANSDETISLNHQNSRYQPPLTRKEFANYLNWEERSSENQCAYPLRQKRASIADGLWQFLLLLA